MAFLTRPVTLCPEVMLGSTKTFCLPALSLLLAPSAASQQVKGVQMRRRPLGRGMTPV